MSARNGSGLLVAGCLTIVLLIGAAIGGSFWFSYGTKETITITVEEKERVTDRKSGDSRYLVWAEVQHEDGSTSDETFEVTDALLQWKFRASDTYGSLDEGETYVVEVNGWRAGWLSSYRNILEAESTQR